MVHVAIIGAGQLGLAAASAFANADNIVTIHARTAPRWNVEGTHFQRYVSGEDPPPGADVLVDTIAFDAEDILRYDPEHIGRLIAISSASVYRDAQGRTLDEAAANGFPQFPDSIDENQQTVEPGPGTYSTRKVRMERQLEAAFGARGTVLRPCAIHGPHSRHPREWWFVKRLLDGRETIPLAYRGESRFQTTAARTIGDAARFCAERELGGVFNVSDADAPAVREIGEMVARLMEREARWIFLDPDPAMPMLGRTPWSIPSPMIVGRAKLKRKGFEAARSYASHGRAAIERLARDPPRNWRQTFPQLAQYPYDMFDYDAEDAIA